MDKLRVNWATDYYVESGNQYGFSVHNRKSKEALSPFVEYSEDAPLAIHVGCAWSLQPIEGVRNVLYWAWDSTEIPPSERDKLAEADAVIVSSSYMIDSIHRVLPDKPVFLCHEGVDVERFRFAFRKRPMPPRRFRFLWIGAPNQRKGYSLVIGAWEAFARSKKVELYMKTTVGGKHRSRGNVIFDSRNLSLADLADLYHSAHAFVFPTMGEGFGLTCAEAMATGLPVIYTPWSALPDLLDESCGYPLEYGIRRFECSTALTKDTPDAKTILPFAVADVDDVATQMMRVFEHYGTAVAKGKAAADRIQARFTWGHTGRRLHEIIAKLYQCWGLAS